LVPVPDLWEVSGVLADTFPLDRSLATAPRWSRRASHWTRLLLVDRAVTNREATAIVTLSNTPWVPAAVAAVVAAALAPRIPAWSRRTLFGVAVLWALEGRRARRFIALRRELARVAPDALLIGDFVARSSGDGMPWATEVFDAMGHLSALVALLPGSGDARRDRARERLYTGQLGFRVASRLAPGGQELSILVRDVPRSIRGRVGVEPFAT